MTSRTSSPASPASPARRRSLLLAATGAAVVLAAVASLGVGAVPVPPGEVWAALTGEPGDEIHRLIVVDLRLPRMLLAVLVGAGLASAGAGYQALFRNPLADPYVIGASSGAAMGATLALLARAAGEGESWLLPLAAFAGALGAVGVVWLLGGVGRRSSPITLLLAGVAVSTFLGACVSLLMILEDRSLRTIFGWLLGGLSGASWGQLAWSAPVILLGVAWTWGLARRIDVMTLGDDAARSLGLSLLGSRAALVVAASLTTAAAVSVAGVIGFVGLMAPHAARLLFGGRHHLLVPASCLLGALLMLLADGAARTLAPPQEIPVGIVTALVGGPFFLYLLRTATRGEIR